MYDKKATMRINARLDTEYASKLAYIQQQTHQGVTDIVKSALDLYYQQLQTEQKIPLELLTQANFIGCGEGDGKLSTNYKTILKTGWQKKYGHR